MVSVDSKSIIAKEKLKIKKKLSFASSIEVICHFLKNESPTIIAQTDRLYVKDSNQNSKHKNIVFSKSIAPAQNTLTTSKVALEKLYAHKNILVFYIQTLNIAYEKLVSVRYSIDQWKSFKDLNAKYHSTISNTIDRFSATLDLNLEVLPTHNCTLQFAIRYIVDGQEYWDNNLELNYKYFCVLIDRYTW